MIKMCARLLDLFNGVIEAVPILPAVPLEYQ